MTKRKTNTATGVYQYLEISGVLDAGSSEDIALKRKEYWNERKRISQQAKRQKETEFKIFFTDKEQQDIAKAAKAHSMSRTRYIKEAALAYTSKQFLIINQASVNHIGQLLALNYSFLQEIVDSTQMGNADIILQKMICLEQVVLAALCNPPIISTNISEP